MRVLVFLIASLTPIALCFKTNRTSCFHYVSCLETIQSNLKDCAGGAAISLTLEAKDVNIRDLVKYRALEFVGCQDRLLKEVVDFDSLQILVNEDARECFEKLPESSKRVEQFTDSCDYVQPLSRNSSKRDALQCLIEFKQDREYCESLLECCPDHTRCGERMNAVSLSYQNARVKAEQIVYTMISCIVVNDPRFLREGARLQSLRDPYRNAGVPFLRPDAYTEARITRRLALTSTSTLSQRRERFMKKYAQIRQVVAQKLFRSQNSKPSNPVEDVVTETSKIFESEAPVVNEEKHQIKTSDPELKKNLEADTEEVSDESNTTIPTTTTIMEGINDRKDSSDVNVNTIRNLIRSASDKDLSSYVTLISEGKFGELFGLAEKKQLMLKTKFDYKLSAKMSKLKEIITEALSDKSGEVDSKNEKSDKEVIPELVTMEENAEEKEQTEINKRDRTSRNVAEVEHVASLQDDVKSTPEDVADKLKEDARVQSKDQAVIDKPVKQKTTDLEDDHHQLPKVLNNEERALLVESEIKQVAAQSRAQNPEFSKSEETEAVEDDIPVIEKEDSSERTSEGVIFSTTTSIPSTKPVEKIPVLLPTTTKQEFLNNTDEILTVVEHSDKEIDGSGEEVDVPNVTTTMAPADAGRQIIDDVKRIRPRTEQTHCQQYASCWQTVMDYEQQCDRKYSPEVLSHGIDDGEILSILQNSSISHHEIVLKACLRPLDRSTHSSLKQLLVIQRGVRKACLDLGRNKIAVTDAEEALCNGEVPNTAAIDEFFSGVHIRSQSNHLTCRAKLEPIREACTLVRSCCASVETCDNYISSSPVKKLETEAIRRLVKRQNDCETKMLQTLSYIHEQLSNPSRRRRFYYH